MKSDVTVVLTFSRCRRSLPIAVVHTFSPVSYFLRSIDTAYYYNGLKTHPRTKLYIPRFTVQNVYVLFYYRWKTNDAQLLI